jgi:hypothetical protein
MRCSKCKHYLTEHGNDGCKHSGCECTIKRGTESEAPPATVQTRLIVDFKIDINPKSWLSRYQRTSVRYIIIMFFFYTIVGNIVASLVELIVIKPLVPSYQPFKFTPSLVESVTAGPLEDGLFFGFPYYASFGNPFIMLASGIYWSVLHLGIGHVATNQLHYGQWMSVIFYLFFTLRTWISGKGWFAIGIHSAYDASLFALGCTVSLCPITAFHGNPFGNAYLVVTSGALLGLIYMLYKRVKPNTITISKKIQYNIAIYLAVLISTSVLISFRAWLVDHTVSLYSIFMIGCGATFLLNFMTAFDSNNKTDNHEYNSYRQQMKWMLGFVGINAVIYFIFIYLAVPRSYGLIVAPLPIGIFIILTYARKRYEGRKVKENGSVMLFSSTREQFMWIAAFVTIIFGAAHAYIANIVIAIFLAYSFLLLMSRYIIATKVS